MDDSNQRMEKLREQLKAANQKILSLSHGQNDDTKAQGNEQNEQKGKWKTREKFMMRLQRSLLTASTTDEAQSQVGQLQSKVNQLEAALSARDQELAAADARYRKSVEKTKEIIKTIDPKALAGKSSTTFQQHISANFWCNSFLSQLKQF